MPDIYGAPRRSQWAESRLRALARIVRPGPIGACRRAGQRPEPLEPATINFAKSRGALPPAQMHLVFFLGRRSRAAARPTPPLAQGPMAAISNPEINIHRGGERHERRS